MKSLFALAASLALASCVGSAPPVANPDKALNQDGTVKYRCIDNHPPPGYQGPVSPYSGSCVRESSIPVVAPSGSHDYSQGQPPRQVR